MLLSTCDKNDRKRGYPTTIYEFVMAIQAVSAYNLFFSMVIKILTKEEKVTTLWVVLSVGEVSLLKKK